MAALRSNDLQPLRLAIVRATALEVICDPLALLVMLASLLLATLAPALHYHQFGEPARMAREAGLSALLMGGIAFAIFPTKATMRREIESGTLQMALAHSVSRWGFLLSKMVGVALAFLVFFGALAGNLITGVRGAELGAAAAQGDIARMWGPSLAIQVATLVVPLVSAAAMNRFARWRFVKTASLLTLLCAVAGTAYRLTPVEALRHLASAALLVAPILFFAAVTLAASVRFASNAANSISLLVVAVSLPFLGSYYLPRALEDGGSIPLSYFAIAIGATVPFIAAALLVAKWLFDDSDIN